MKILNRHSRLLYSDAKISIGTDILFNQMTKSCKVLCGLNDEVGYSHYPLLNFVFHTLHKKNLRFDVLKENGINGFSLEKLSAAKLNKNVIVDGESINLVDIKKLISPEQFELLPYSIRLLKDNESSPKKLNLDNRLSRLELDSVKALGVHFKKVYKTINALHRKIPTFQNYEEELSLFKKRYSDINFKQISISDLSKSLDVLPDELILVFESYLKRKYGESIDINKEFRVPLIKDMLEVFKELELEFNVKLYKKIRACFLKLLRSSSIPKIEEKVRRKHDKVFKHFFVFNHFRNIAFAEGKKIKSHFERYNDDLSPFLEHFFISYLCQIKNSISFYEKSSINASVQTESARKGATKTVLHIDSSSPKDELKLIAKKIPLKRTGPKLLLDVLNRQLVYKSDYLQVLQKVFGIDNKRLTIVLPTFNLNDFGRLSSNSKKASNYSSYEILKKSGGFRKIVAPKKNLKALQQCANFFLSHFYIPPNSSHGFISQKSIITNAHKHKNKKFVMNIDLKDFFPSISFYRIKSSLKNLGLDQDTALSIANLSTLHNVLPQGAPTSPILSNIICKKLDYKLRNLAFKNNCVYTRYADDITFSTNKYGVLSLENENFLNSVVREIKKFGFKLNNKKTRVQHYSQRQEVTGLVVNEKVNVNRQYLRTVRAMLNNWEKAGLRHAQDRFEKVYIRKDEHTKSLFRKVNESVVAKEDQLNTKYSFLASLAGRIEFIKSVKGVNDAQAIKFASKFRSLLIRDKDLNEKTKVTTGGVILKGVPLDTKSPQDVKLKEHFNNLRTKRPLRYLTHSNHDEGYVKNSEFSYDVFMNDCHETFSKNGVVRWMFSKNCSNIYNLLEDFVKGDSAMKAESKLPISWSNKDLKNLIKKYGLHPASTEFIEKKLSIKEKKLLERFKESMDLINDSFRMNSRFFIDKLNEMNKIKIFNIYHIDDNIGYSDLVYSNLLNLEKVLNVLLFKNIYFANSSDLFLNYSKIKIDDENILRVSIRVYNSDKNKSKNISHSKTEMQPGGDMTQVYALSKSVFNISVIANYSNGWHSTCYQKDKQSKIDINDVELTEIIFNNYPKYDVYSDFYQFDFDFII